MELAEHQKVTAVLEDLLAEDDEHVEVKLPSKQRNNHCLMIMILLQCPEFLFLPLMPIPGDSCILG